MHQELIRLLREAGKELARHGLCKASEHAGGAITVLQECGSTSTEAV